MTHRRHPYSAAAALDQVTSLLGIEELARVADRRPGTVRAWSNPERSEDIPLPVALRLDQAHLAAGGEVPPILTWYIDRLRACVADLPATVCDLGASIAVCAKEAGEAISAQIVAARPDASHRDRIEAARETDEAIAALAATRHRLVPALEAGAPL